MSLSDPTPGVNAAGAPVTPGGPVRSGRRWISEVALTLAAVGGGLCMVVVAAAVVFDVSLVLFRTGSMSPTIPTGSVAAIRRVEAADVAPGDVVTVARPGRLPVTHRVVSSQPGSGDLTSLVLKGDANPGPDPEPYEVAHVGHVLFSVPRAAPVVAAASHPLALGGLSVVVAALVTWAFWPAPPDRSAAGPRPTVGAQVGP